MDVLKPTQRRHNMQSIRAKDTKPEIMLRLALWHKGIRYRKNLKTLPGTPDIVLMRQKISMRMVMKLTPESRLLRIRTFG